MGKSTAHGPWYVRSMFGFGVVLNDREVIFPVVVISEM